MAVFYLDTSAALKRYITEKGTDVVTELYEGRTKRDTLITSHFTCLEVEATAARAVKGGRLNRRANDAMLAAFSRDLESNLNLVSVGSMMLGDAAEVIRVHGLRAPDALQVASARWLAPGMKAAPGSDVVMVVSDQEIIAAADAYKMNTLDPEAADAMEKLRKYREK